MPHASLETMKKKIFLMGANGHVGRNLATELVHAGASVRAGTRNPKKALPIPGIEWVYFDLGDSASIAKSLEGVQRAFFMSPPGFSNQYEVFSPLIRRAKASGLEKVVLMTAFGADANPSIPFRQAELELEATGMRHAFVRPNWFMDNFKGLWSRSIRERKTLAIPAGNAKVSLIDSRDIAEVTSLLLTNDAFHDGGYDLTGPEALNMRETTELYSKAAGFKVTYTDFDQDAYLNSFLEEGYNLAYARVMVHLFKSMREGHAAAVTETVRAVTGHTGRTFAQWCARNIT